MSARMNDATSAEFKLEALENPFAEGSVRWVAQGCYTQGRRAGQLCVGKWFKYPEVLGYDDFLDDIKSVNAALHILSGWNARRVVDKHVQMNKPEIWTFGPGSGPWSGRQVLQEPFLHNFRKWNSNTGWCDVSATWPRIMQALSHFSYHDSDGEFVLCDLQGSLHSNGVILTDPVIMSRKQSFGITDLGPRGISTFFASHACNEYCRRQWLVPKHVKGYYENTKATTAQYAPTQHSKSSLSERLSNVRTSPQNSK